MNTSEIQGYLPQLRENGFARPLIACDLTGIDLTLIGWKDDIVLLDSYSTGAVDNNFVAHNLAEDAKRILGSDFRPAAFSQVRQWK